MRTRRRFAAVAAGASALLCLATVSGVVGASAAGAASTPRRTYWRGAVVSAKARQRPVGAVARSARVDFALVLKLRNAAAAAALVRAVSTPGSPSYRHYLTTAQWESRFSPAASQVASARKLAAQRGLQGRQRVQGPHHRLRVGYRRARWSGRSGPSWRISELNGRTVRLATKELSVPASLGRSVIGAMGVNQNVATPDAAARHREPGDRHEPVPAGPGRVHHFSAVRHLLRAEVATVTPAVRARLPGQGALPGVRLQARPVPLGLQRQLGQHRQGRHRGHHRRLRLSHDQQRRDHVLRQERSRATRSATRASASAWPLPSTTRPCAVPAAGWPSRRSMSRRSTRRRRTPISCTSAPGTA